MTDAQSSLVGFEWNSAILDGQGRDALLTVVAFDRHRVPHVIGTAFALNCDGDRAICVTAAHVFAEVRRLQTPEPLHSRSALPEFLPPPREVDIDRRRLRVLCMNKGRPIAAVVEGIAFDERKDIAFFSLGPQSDGQRPMHIESVLADGNIPAVGDVVCVLSLRGQGIAAHSQVDKDAAEFQISRAVDLRCGRVRAYHPEGHRLCKGPCVETTIPVFSGMSGGPAVHYGSEGSRIHAFGLVCSDPDIDGPNKMDRSVAGSSIIALLPVQSNDGTTTRIAFDVTVGNAAGELKPPWHKPHL